MFRFLGVRFLEGLVAVFLASIVVFVLARSTGNPAVLMLPLTATRAEVEAMSRRLGTDRPLAEQYARFVARAAVGDFGHSIRYRLPVLELVGQRLPASFTLAGLAMVAAGVLAAGLGLASALSRSRLTDGLLRAIGILGISVPSFWLSIVLIWVFGVHFKVLPTSGSGGLRYMILPATALSLYVMGGMARLLRSNLSEVLQSPYIRAAHARGLSTRTIIVRHVMRNALAPVLAFAGVQFPLLISSAVVVETVFAWPGLGRLAFEAVVARDFPVIQGVTLVGSALVVCTSLVADMLHAMADPRVTARLLRG